MRKMRVLDLFSGIGGFTLGLERTGGFETVAFCEIDPYCRKVLSKHWPKVPKYEDICSLTAAKLAADGITVDVITGGFPCQDVSLAGKRAGLDGERSGLWTEMRRLIGELRPKFVFVENTPGLLSLGMGTVLGDLATLRYDAEWHCIPAAYVGADHIRDRIWIIAYDVARKHFVDGRSNKSSKEMEGDASDTLRAGLHGRGDTATATNRTDAGTISERLRLALRSTPVFPRQYRELKPVLGRGVHGVPNRAHRIAGLGNAVVPQIPEVIGRVVLHKINMEAGE